MEWKPDNGVPAAELEGPGAARLYGDLAAWWPLMSPVADHAEEADFSPGMLECSRAINPDAEHEPHRRAHVEWDRHVEGIFPRATWLRLLADAGFDARVVPFDDSELEPGTYEVFVATKA